MCMYVSQCIEYRVPKKVLECERSLLRKFVCMSVYLYLYCMYVCMYVCVCPLFKILFLERYI